MRRCVRSKHTVHQQPHTECFCVFSACICSLVEYGNGKLASQAIEQLNNTELEGRTVQVREDKVTEAHSIGDVQVGS